MTADGRSERGNFPVYRRPMKQWMLRITAYADRLLDDLDLLDWSDAIKAQQRNWIGRSTGANVHFASPAGPIEVFTTRPDTLFGATYMVLAPEHPLVASLTGDSWPDDAPASWSGGAASPAEAIAAYVAAAARRSELDRQSDARAKTGVFTGTYATNPANGRPVPVFVADYVLMGYGTGAIMAVPAHDQRDFDFARTFDLPITEVVSPAADWLDRHGVAAGTARPTGGPRPMSGDGVAVHSANDDLTLDGLGVAEAKAAMTAWLEGHGTGEGTVQYKLRDWLFSRQRYWGEPFPIVFGPDGRTPGPARGPTPPGAAAHGGLHPHDLRGPGLRARAAARAGAGLVHRDARPGRRRRPAGVPARAQHHAQLGRVVLVRAALPRPHQ